VRLCSWSCPTRTRLRPSGAWRLVCIPRVVPRSPADYFILPARTATIPPRAGPPCQMPNAACPPIPHGGTAVVGFPEPRLRRNAGQFAAHRTMYAPVCTVGTPANNLAQAVDRDDG
jgi:hypothetical protein